MAADNGIDLRSVSGSGPNGRIIKRDIEEALASGTQKSKTKDQKPFTPSTIVGASAFSDEPTSKMRAEPSVDPVTRPVLSAPNASAFTESS